MEGENLTMARLQEQFRHSAALPTTHSGATEITPENFTFLVLQNTISWQDAATAQLWLFLQMNDHVQQEELKALSIHIIAYRWWGKPFTTGQDLYV